MPQPTKIWLIRKGQTIGPLTPARFKEYGEQGGFMVGDLAFSDIDARRVHPSALLQAMRQGAAPPPPPAPEPAPPPFTQPPDYAPDTAAWPGSSLFDTGPQSPRQRPRRTPPTAGDDTTGYESQPFKHLITPWVLRFLFWAGIVLIVLWCAMAELSLLGAGAGAGMLTTIPAANRVNMLAFTVVMSIVNLVASLVAAVLWRVTCETTAIFFMSHARLRAIEDLLRTQNKTHP